jgi:hypothetical protein
MEVVAMSLTKREIDELRKPKTAVVEAEQAYLDDECPLLGSILQSVPDGASAKLCGCLTIFWDPPVFKVCVNDRAFGRSGWISLPVLDGTILERLEMALRSDSFDWRSNNGKKPWKKYPS